jgi:hypothetical protein
MVRKIIQMTAKKHEKIIIFDEEKEDAMKRNKLYDIICTNVIIRRSENDGIVEMLT